MIISAFGAVGIIVALTLTFLANRLSQKEFLAVHGPKLVIGNLHAWNEGGGGLYNTGTKPLVLTVGAKIHVAVIASNLGSADAEKVDGDCSLHWLSKNDFSMIKLNWAPKKPVGPTSIVDEEKEPAFSAEKLPTVKPVHACGWLLETTVERGKALYVLGILFYRDRLGNMRAQEFIRKYDPKIRYFVPVDDPEKPKST